MPTEEKNEAAELMAQLSTCHPDYDEWAPSWKRYRDLLGECEVDKKDYLPRGHMEAEKDYLLRLELSEFVPESPLAIGKILGALFKQKPTRDLKGKDRLTEVMQNTDLRGTKWDESMSAVAETLLGYGSTRLLCTSNRPDDEESGSLNVDGKKVITVADEKNLGVRAYLINYSPLAVIDWDCDERGNLQMVRIKEQRWVRSEANKYGHAQETRFIVYTKTHVKEWVFVTDGGKTKLKNDVPEKEHGLGMVPMVVGYYPKMIKPMIGAGYIRMASRCDLRKIRAESDLHYDAYMHAHPLLAIKTQDELAKVGIGSNTYIKLDPSTNEDAFYVDMPIAPFQALKEVIEHNTLGINRHTGTDPLGVLQAGSSAFQSSGVNRAWSYETSEGRILSRVADKMEGIERNALDIITRTQEAATDPKKPAFQGSVQYPEDFDTAAVAGLLENTERTAPLLNSPTLERVLHKRIASSLAGEVAEGTMGKIFKEIDSRPLKSADAASLPGVLGMPGKAVGMRGEDEDEEEDEHTEEDTPAKAATPQARQERRARA